MKPRRNGGSIVEDGDSEGEAEDDELEEDENEDNVEPGSTRHRSSKNPAETLKFYPSGWQFVLQTARQHWRLHIATENPFPNRSEHLKDAAALLTRIIQEYKADGYVLESSCTRPSLST